MTNTTKTLHRIVLAIRMPERDVMRNCVETAFSLEDARRLAAAQAKIVLDDMEHPERASIEIVTGGRGRETVVETLSCAAEA